MKQENIVGKFHQNAETFQDLGLSTVDVLKIIEIPILGEKENSRKMCRNAGKSCQNIELFFQDLGRLLWTF